MELVFLIVLLGAWLISPIILLIALVIARRQVRLLRDGLAEPSRPIEASPPLERSPPILDLAGGDSRYGPVDMENLVLLRLELNRLLDSGALASAQHQQLASGLDRLWQRHLGESGVQAEDANWQRRRLAAWRLLAQGAETPPGLPPWSPATVAAVPDLQKRAAPEHVTDEEPLPVTIPPLPAWTVAPSAAASPVPPAIPAGPSDAEESAKRPIARPVVEAALPAGRVVKDMTALDATAWRPAPPSPLEKALQAMSGWPKLIAPFLAQNVGWFVGGFCFIAGALFLIANTSGFLNALVVFASLFVASAFLLWAGYQFRRKRPELAVAGNMLVTLGMLLAPLVLGMSTRLVVTGHGDALPMTVGLVLAMGTLVAFAWAANLAAALIDRVLQGRYARLLTALAAVQLAAPLAGFVPDWRVLMVLHALLLGLLGYGLWIFASEWLRRLFVDRRLTTYYAVGMLAYTAIVSFVHLTWLWPDALPVGYTGPFLMALCGLLCPVDAALKEWVNKYAFLSRFTFVLYGLSAVAIAIAFQSTLPLLLTLALGVLLYGWMAWRYRTLPPLYLLFGCTVGLYGSALLHWLPPAWHGLAGAPGLLALLLLGRWAGPRWPLMAQQCIAAFAVLLVGLMAWSLPHNAPGWLGFTTAALAAGLAYLATQWLLPSSEVHTRWRYAGYGVAGLAAVAIGYLPDLLGLDWAMQTSYGWLALAGLWAALGLHAPRQSLESRRVWVTSALATVALALLLMGLALWPALFGRLEPILLLILAGALLLWLSLSLRRQALFYGVLACIAGAGLLVKRGYFPEPGTGIIEFILVAALWVILWRLAWRLRVRRMLAAEDLDNPSVESLSESAELSVTTLIRQPLEQAMALLWAVGLVQLGLAFLNRGLAARWPVTVGLGVVTGLLLIGYFRLFRWAALPFVLGLVGLLVGLERMGFTLPWLATVAVLYVLLVWRVAVVMLAQPAIERLVQVLDFTVPGGADGRRQVEESLFGFALLVAALLVAASPGLTFLGLPALALLPALVLAGLLFLVGSWHYRSARYAYAVLITLTVIGWLLEADWTSPSWLGLGQPLVNALLSAGMALVGLGLESEKAAPLAYWRLPVQRSSTLLYLLALAGALLAGLLGDIRLPILLALLCVALLPVARPWPNAAAWRGFGLALLSSALAWSLTGWGDFSRLTEVWLVVGWGYALWFDGNLLLPRWNARHPGWAVAPDIWPLLGLVCVLGGGVFGVMSGVLSPAVGLVAVALYLFLVLRNTAWPGMAWLAVGTLTAVGLFAGADLAWWSSAADLSGLSQVLVRVVVALLWLNGIFFLGALWQRNGQRWAHGLGWRQANLAGPLFWLPFAVFVLLLVRLGWLECGLFWRWALPEPALWGLIAATLLLTATAGHAFHLRPKTLQAHGVLLALVLLLAAIFLKLALPLPWMPLVLACWNGALLLAWHYRADRWLVWRSALGHWLAVLPALILALLWTLTGFEWGSITATLGVLSVVVLVQGWWQSEAARLKLGLVLGLAASYTAWLIGTTGLPVRVLGALTPWYALQTVFLLLILMSVQSRLTAWLNDQIARVNEGISGRLYEIEQALQEALPWLLTLTLLWLGAHVGARLAYETGWGAVAWNFDPSANSLPAGMTMLLLVGLAGVRAWRQPNEARWIYATALLLGLLGAYGRLVWFGLAPLMVGDTVILLAAAYTVFLLHQWTASRPLYRLALLLPLLALMTVPWQLASAWTGGALLAVAVLYLSLAGTLRNPLPLYLGVLALNGAVYLWAPLWAGRYGLWQFYLIPAAVSVLVLLHLHRRELRPKVLSTARLAALSALYAGAGLDVFLRPELWVFVLALVLALAGVILGIALRVRAFLYAGVAFLVLNVLGQLLRFYPDQGLSRALILIGLGALITVGMVLFNLKREEIMQRIRIVRADLAAWE